MIRADLTYDEKLLRSIEKALAVKSSAVNQAMGRAQNKTAKSMRAEASRLIRSDFNIKQSIILSSVRVLTVGSFRPKMVAGIKGKGSPGIPLIDFKQGSKATPSTRRLKSGGYSPKKGIKVKVEKSAGALLMPGTFLAKMKSGHKGAFHRIEGTRMRGSNKEKLDQLFGPSPVKLLAGDRYKRKMERYTKKTMDKYLAHNMQQLLKKQGIG